MNPEFDLDGVDWRRILEHHLDPHVILEAVEGATGGELDYRIRWANQAARARPALSGIDLDGTLLSQILDPQLTAAMGAFFATALRDSGFAVIRDVRASVSGAPAESRFDVWMAPLGGRCLASGWREVSRDVREHERSAARLERLRLRAEADSGMELVLEDATVGMAITNVDGSFDYVNPYLCAMLGYPRAELTGMRFADLTHPDDRSLGVDALMEMREGIRDSFLQRKRYLSSDGESVWIDLTVLAVREEDRQLRHMFAQMVDVSAEVRAAEFLRAANNLNELALTMATQDEISAALLFHLRQLLAADVGLLVGLEQGLWTIWQVSEEGLASDATAVLAIDGRLSDPVLVEAFAAAQLAAGSLPDDGSVDPALEGLGSWLVLPLGPDYLTSGLAVLFRRSGRRSFDQHDGELAEPLAAQGALAASYSSVRELEEEETVLRDRNRIARDLHDLTIQRLFALGMALEAQLADSRDQIVSGTAKDSVAEINSIIRELRSSIAGLQTSPDAIEASGLRMIVARELARAEHTLRKPPTLKFDAGAVDRFPRDLVDAVAAAVAEGLSNAARHADCTRVKVALRVQDGTLRLRIKDDGSFDPSKPVRLSGLANLRTRARDLGGDSSLDRVDDSTVLTWWAPCE